MDLLEESIVPEHARPVKQEARAFAEAHIEPNAEERFREAAYPWEILEAAREADLIAQDIP